MRVLVFGDVHGNLVALEKLFEIEQGYFDLFVCHGDIVNYGPWTNECLDFLSHKKDGILLQGNHEEYYMDGTYPGTNVVAKSFFEFCYPNFYGSYLPFISEFKKSYQIGDYKITHSIDGLYVFKDTDIANLDFKDNTIVGHSHQQFHRIINNKNLYNTGSLGQNRSLLDFAQYLVLDTEKNIVEMKSFIFDIQIVISKMKESRYPSICLDYYKSKNTVNK
ncbi:metallophosphoesterase family protein [Pedobacter sp. 22226]|uniref:metallophosphoesterase family protein n=1 Tax=Pedobacter sp. 22226 TaxID=3453894 RepID=UPI003F830605